MRRIVVGLLVAGVLAGGVATTVGVPGPGETAIVAVYPNPVADGDAGEYVALSVPNGTNLAGWTLADDDATVALPNVTVSGQIVFSTDPDRARNMTDATVYELDGHLALANGGENLTVGDGNRVVARLGYRDAPEGEVARVKDGGISWELLGGTDVPVRTTGPGRVRTFVLPDAGGLPSDVLASADDRILLAGYTFRSRRATETLIAARERGVEVRVLLEGGPVGGMSRRQAELLDRLVANGVTVRVVDGPYARFDHHHAKYAVVDDRALVLTENWKPAGTGGTSSRGWGVLLTQRELVADLVATFRADIGWRDAVHWEQFRDGRAFSEGGRTNGSFQRRYRPRTHRATGAALLVAPDNAESGVIERLDGAEESISVVQVGVGGPEQAFVRALKRAADRGVDVRLLLSRAWYAAEDNRAVAEELERWADRADASLSVRLARPRDRFGKIHAKGVVIDGDIVLLGSLNWNDHSARENREVVVVLEGEGPAGYYERVFRGDWRAAIWRLSIGLAAVVLLTVMGATLVGRRIEFDGSVGVDAVENGSTAIEDRF
ncbi:phospholipase D-like domain-containing protein [Halorhabdus amylolytica]|uniref:phospholipase D-like domain-containing protein n=1 Tax=Halorhabdus amylolytica TaxID=2559573 RepID=UPI0020BFA68A|nr:phospholipase D-like domain-containing protein [Halorhabdus amylolytica]